MENKKDIEKLLSILDTKIVEGLDKLKTIDIDTEKFTVCFNNLLTSLELVTKLTYKPNKNN